MLNAALQEVEKTSTTNGQMQQIVRSYIERSFGVVEARDGRWKEAGSFLNRSLEIMPANASCRYLLGMQMLELGHARAALKSMEESLLLDPDAKTTWPNAAVAALRLGYHTRAREICESGLARHPGTPQLLYNLAVAAFGLSCQEEEKKFGHIARQLRAEALEAFRQARDSRNKDQPWTERDEELVSMLEQESKPLACKRIDMPRDGWKFIGWRA